jgi:secreted protein with Ig-like and vWFA domain
MSNNNGDNRLPHIDPELVTAFALGELTADDAAPMRAQFESPGGEQLQSEIAELQRLTAAIASGLKAEHLPESSKGLREAINRRLGDQSPENGEQLMASGRRRKWWQLRRLEWAAVGGIAIILIGLMLPAVQNRRESARRMQSSNTVKQIGIPLQKYHDVFQSQSASVAPSHLELRMMVTPRIIVQEESEAILGIELPPDGMAGGGFDWDVTISKRTASESSTERYAPIHENRFLSPLQNPLSIFSIDVDTASYANVRRFLNSGRLPPVDSVRIEELVNYFPYSYLQPAAGQPFSVNMEVAECPWCTGHWLLRVGLKGRDIERQSRPPSNLVFLLDVSGSMADANKLPLLKTAMKMLASELGEDDRVSIVTYAGDAGLKLSSTRGDKQRRIIEAIDSLSAGGSTNGSAGIELAYRQAEANFIQNGANRVILCTDGDLNVGITSDAALVELIQKKAAGGTFLTVLGFGEGNLQDAKLESIADNGNGLYAYIDSVREARKVLVQQLTGSTITIAKDVKIQIEFNPALVSGYRLLGYENRVLAAQDFNNDKKDAGDIGAGHTVTALYELLPASAASEEPHAAVDPLKYQQPGANLLPEEREGEIARGASGPGLVPAKGVAESGELLTLKLRYKEPDGATSKLLEYPLKADARSFHAASPDFQFAAAVASFGMILRNSQYRGSSNLAAVAEIASSALGKDEGGHRAEFVDLVQKAQSLAR